MSDPNYFRFDAGGSAVSAANPLPVTVTGGGGGATTIANGADVAEGSTTDAAYTDSTGAAAGTQVGLEKGLFVAMKATGTGAQAIQGNVAHGVTDAGSPVGIGGYASTAVPTSVTAGQRVHAWYGISGQAMVNLTDGVNTTSLSNGSSDALGTTSVGLVVRAYNLVYNGATYDRARGDTGGTVVQPHAMTASRWVYAAAASGITNTTTAVTFIAAAGAGVRNYVAAIQIFAGALGAATEIAIRDGAAGTVLWRGWIGTAGYSDSIMFPVPLKGTANTLMEVVTLTASITGAVYFNAQGHQGS